MPSTVYFDYETQAGPGAPDLRRAGAYRYAAHADAIVLAYAIDDGPVKVVATGQPLAWTDLPDLHEPFAAGATFVAWNASFDRAIWNYSLIDSPFLAPERVQDAMAAALANNLPPDLERASTLLTGRGKLTDGKRLISLFCNADSPPIDTASEDWKKFLAYASIDVVRLREVCKIMRPLPQAEWAVYAASEAINDRGIPVDLFFAEKAAALAAQDVVRTNARLTEITNGEITSVYQHERIASWAYNRLNDAEARAILVSYIPDPEENESEIDEEETPPVPVLSCKRPNIVRLQDWLERRDMPDPALYEVLSLREFGAGASPKKFQAMLSQHVNGRLHGQLVFNGAGQTGRFSAKGTQIQNQVRSTLGSSKDDDTGFWEPPTIDLIADGCSLEELARHGLGEPPAKKLALLVRPAIMAPIGRTLVKADYSQIEARVLPWLAGGDTNTSELLAAFQRADSDPTAPDLYKVTAAGMLHKPASEITKPERQTGKVATLACGFQGGKNALMSMATAYGMYLSPEEAQIIVTQWRAANPWAEKFWGRHNKEESYGLYGAAMRAVASPGSLHWAGRVAFLYQLGYLGNSLFLRLPSGRLLTYPWCKVRDYDITDKQTGAVVDKRRGLTFKRPSGLVALYGGRFAENATQAAAADLLRQSLVDLAYLDVIMHAHDEIVVEVDEAHADEAAADLREVMEAERSWTKGLPLSVEVTERFYYSSARQKLGSIVHGLAGLMETAA